MIRSRQDQPLVTLETAILEAKVKEAEANVVIEQTQVAYLSPRWHISRKDLMPQKRMLTAPKPQWRLPKRNSRKPHLPRRFDGTIASVDISPAEYCQPWSDRNCDGRPFTFQIETTDLSEKNVPSVKIGSERNCFY